MDRSRAEQIRRDSANWKFGVIYISHDDPRLFVRNRNFIGWTWNFGHSLVWMALAVTILVFSAAIYIGFVILASLGAVLALFLILLMFLVSIAHAIASGPR